MRMRFVILSSAFLVIFAVNAFVYAADIDTGLLAYWPLDNDANDVISGHNGELVGGASFVDDPVRGKVLEVDGNDGRVEVPHADSIVFVSSDSYTLSIWVNVLTLPGHWSGVVNKSRDAGPWYGIWVNGSNSWVAGDSNITGSAVQAGGWYHVVLVQDGAANTRNLYVDGNVDTTGTAIDVTGGGDLWMGGAKSVSEFINARIDDVTLYGRALSEDDVLLLMEGPPTAVEPVDKLATTWGSMK